MRRSSTRRWNTWSSRTRRRCARARDRPRAVAKDDR
jgi:hypothetical protein